MKMTNTFAKLRSINVHFISQTKQPLSNPPCFASLVVAANIKPKVRV
jgi:hypothetical protein